MGQAMDMLQNRLTGKTLSSKEPLPESDPEFKDLRRELVKNKVARDLVSDGKAPVSKEDATVASALVKANADLVTTFMTQAKESMKGGKDGEEHLFMKYLVDKVEKLESNSPDPLALYRGMQEIINEMQAHGKDPKGSPVGISGEVAVAIKKLELDAATAASKLTLEIENMKDAREKDKQDREDARQDRQMMWDRDNRRWEAEFGLKSMEAKASAKSKAAIGEQAGDLIGSIAESFTGGGGGQQVAAGGARPQQQQRMQVPKSIKCECGETVLAPTPGAPLIKCDKCGAEYELSEK